LLASITSPEGQVYTSLIIKRDASPAEKKILECGVHIMGFLVVQHRIFLGCGLSHHMRGNIPKKSSF
jgi:hypothetical protein